MFPAGANPVEVALGRVDDDADLDAVFSDSTSGQVQVLLGAGDGTLGSPTTYAAGTNPNGISLGDLTGDAKLDIVVADRSGPGVDVLTGNGDGTFGTATSLTTAISPLNEALGDFDDDGNLDIAAASGAGDAVSVLINTAAPTVTSVTPAQGPTAGGTEITIVGTGFVPGTEVSVGGNPATDVQLVNRRKITAKTPAGSAGTSAVRVVRPDTQEATAAGAFTYEAPAHTHTPHRPPRQPPRPRAADTTPDSHLLRDHLGQDSGAVGRQPDRGDRRRAVHRLPSQRSTAR